MTLLGVNKYKRDNLFDSLSRTPVAERPHVHAPSPRFLPQWCPRGTAWGCTSTADGAASPLPCQGCQMAKFNPFLSLDCTPRPPPWRNPRRGRDQILPFGNLGKGGEKQLRLLCWCSPKRCHADAIVAKIVEIAHGHASGAPQQVSMTSSQKICPSSA